MYVIRILRHYSEIIKKCRFVNNLSSSTPIDEVYKTIIQQLYQYRKKHVAELLEKFHTLVKEGLAVKRNYIISKALQIGAVDTLLVSANSHTQYISL